ncbi:MAG: translocation/assembly module TamB domain-containing protein [Candidatus Omnitrophota bacterium]
MNIKFFKHFLLSVLMLLCWASIFICILAYTFLTTTWGAKLAATYLIQSYVPFCSINVGSYQGTIEKGLVLKDVRINHIPMIKEGGAHIQELHVQVPLIHWDQIAMKIINGKLQFSSADPIVFNAVISKNQIQGNCYAQSIDAHQFLLSLGYNDLAKNIQGFLSKPDFVLQGTMKAPRLTGRFFVDSIVYKDTSVKDGFGHLDLTIKALGLNPWLDGFVILESAFVRTNRVNVDLSASRVDFKGDVTNPALDIHGSSKVEDIDIDMAIKGSLLKPQLTFNSDPPLPEEEIIYTLATGKTWSGIEDARSQGFGLRRKLSDTFNVGMALEERPSQPGRDQSLGYSRMIEGQMNVTDKFSLNIAKKFLPTDSNNTSSQPEKDNSTEFYLQYKKRF